MYGAYHSSASGGLKPPPSEAARILLLLHSRREEILRYHNLRIIEEILCNMSNTRMNRPRFIMRMEDNILFAIITIK